MWHTEIFKQRIEGIPTYFRTESIKISLKEETDRKIHFSKYYKAANKQL